MMLSSSSSILRPRALIRIAVVIAVGSIPLVICARRTAGQVSAVTQPASAVEYADVPPLLNPRSRDHLVAVGIAGSILVPIVGFIIGIVLLFKERIGPGLGCVLLSLAMMSIYYVQLVDRTGM